jgi:hypothetical protein
MVVPHEELLLIEKKGAAEEVREVGGSGGTSGATPFTSGKPVIQHHVEYSLSKMVTHDVRCDDFIQ